MKKNNAKTTVAKNYDLLKIARLTLRATRHVNYDLLIKCFIMLDSESIHFIRRLYDVLLMTEKHKNDIGNFILISRNTMRVELMI